MFDVVLTVQAVQGAPPLQPAEQPVSTNMQHMPVQLENSLPTYESIEKK